MPHDMKPRAHAGIAAAAVWLPANRQSCEAAVREGELTRRAADDLGHATLPVAEDVSAPDMAVRAGESALGRGGVRAEDVTSLYHAYMHYQGHDLWPVAHYIAHGLGASDAVPVGIQQICNGGTTAVELAFSRLAQDEDPGFAVVTTADRFVPPAFDRWTSDYGVAYGDVGTSAVLTTDPAHPCPLLLRSVCTTAAPTSKACTAASPPSHRHRSITRPLSTCDVPSASTSGPTASRPSTTPTPPPSSGW